MDDSLYVFYRFGPKCLTDRDRTVDALLGTLPERVAFGWCGRPSADSDLPIACACSGCVQTSLRDTPITYEEWLEWVIRRLVEDRKLP